MLINIVAILKKPIKRKALEDGVESSTPAERLSGRRGISPNRLVGWSQNSLRNFKTQVDKVYIAYKALTKTINSLEEVVDELLVR